MAQPVASRLTAIAQRSFAVDCDQVSLHIRRVKRVNSFELKGGVVSDGVVEPRRCLLCSLEVDTIEHQKITMGAQEFMCVSDALRIVAGIVISLQQVVVKYICTRTRECGGPVQQKVITGSRLLRIPHNFCEIQLPANHHRSVGKTSVVQAFYIEKSGILAGRPPK